MEPPTLVMAGCGCRDEQDDREDKEQKQSVLEPALEKAVEAAFEMLDTPPGFAFDAV
jgi:hypothetical protein